MSLEFDTAAEAKIAEANDQEITTPITFEPGTEDERVIQVSKPNEGQFAMLMASMGRGSSDGDMIGGTINFFLGLLNDEDQYYVATRLMDKDDEFSKKGGTHIRNFIKGLSEAWSGRPFQPLSVSTQLPESDGSKSTPPTPESISSASPSTVF